MPTVLALIFDNHRIVSISNPIQPTNQPTTGKVMEAASSLNAEVTARRKELSESRFADRAGKKGPSGRMDYRASSTGDTPINIIHILSTSLMPFLASHYLLYPLSHR